MSLLTLLTNLMHPCWINPLIYNNNNNNNIYTDPKTLTPNYVCFLLVNSEGKTITIILISFAGATGSEYNTISMPATWKKCDIDPAIQPELPETYVATIEVWLHG